MNNRLAIAARSLLALGVAGCLSGCAQQVLTQHNDNARTGANLLERKLNTANVNVQQFGKLFERSVDGSIYAQPLIATRVEIAGKGTHNVVYLATMHNSVFAFDADDPAASGPLWVHAMEPSVPLPDSQIGGGGYNDIWTEIGILSTPVIEKKLNAIYLVTFSKQGDTYSHHLHALDLGSGQELKGSPQAIDASVSGTGSDSSDGRVTLRHNQQSQRPALLLSNGTIYIGFGSYGDHDPWHGWLLGYRVDDLTQPPTVFNTTANGGQGGIWQAGQGPSADALGNVYISTGNGSFGGERLVSKVTLSETASGAPALANFNDQRIALAWTGTDSNHHVNVLTSTDAQSIAGKVTLGGTSLDGPALAAGNGTLILGWTASDSSQRIHLMSSTDAQAFGSEVVLGETSAFGPALAFGNGLFFLAWTGTDGSHSLNVMSSTDGLTFGNKVTLGESSDAAPQLAFIRGTLFLLWRGRDFNQSLNILSSSDGVNFASKVTLGESSDHAPALIQRAGLMLMWTGRDWSHSLNLLTGSAPNEMGNMFDGKVVFSDSSNAAPAVVRFEDHILIAWTGTDSRGEINIAQVGTPSLGESIVKLRPDLLALDWFSPWINQQFSKDDIDLGAAGVLLIPQTGLLIGGGKEGRIYVMDRNHLGGHCPLFKCGDSTGDDQIEQSFQATMAHDLGHPADHSGGFHHIHGTPVFWNRPKSGPTIYVGGEADNLKAFVLVGNTFDTAHVELSQVTTPDYSMPGAMLSLSAFANLPGTGILWASHPLSDNANQKVVHGIVRAIDAGDLTHELWNSTQNLIRDDLGNCSKFSAPTVANGKVYVPTFSNKLVVYGLNPPQLPTITGKVTLPETAIGAPALADFGDQQLALAWTGTDAHHHLNILTSADGSTFASKVVLAERGIDGPALAAGNGKLYLGWTGTGFSSNLNVMQSTDLANFTGKVTLGETSPFGPALAFGNGQIFLAWVGTDGNHSLNVMSSRDGVTFAGKVTLGESSDSAPGLAFADGTLYLLWRGRDANHSLNILSSTDGVSFSSKITLAESSDFAPAMIKAAAAYLAVWTSRDLAHPLNALTGPQVAQLGGKRTFADVSVAAPALAGFKNHSFIAWIESDNPSFIDVGQIGN